MFPLTRKFYPSVFKHVCVHMCILTHTGHFFLLAQTSLCNSMFVTITPLPTLLLLLHSSANHLAFLVKGWRRIKPVSLFFTEATKPLLFFPLFNLQTKHELKTDVVVGFRHAKQLKPSPRSGCDIPWVFGAIHIPLAILDTNAHLQLNSLSAALL